MKTAKEAAVERKTFRRKEKPSERNVPRAEKPDDWVETLQLEGRNAVLEALNHQKPIDRILLKKEADGSVSGTLNVIMAKARENGVVAQAVDRAKLDAITQSGNHQGVIALCPAKEYVSVDDMLAIAEERGEPPFLLLLDGITDPHNLGAILRTAEAGGVHGVLIPKRRAVGLTGAVAKTSAGAIQHMAVAKIGNVANTLSQLKAKGFWVACAHMEGTPLFAQSGLDMAGPIVLVIGAEGDGVSRLVQETCDFALRIPMKGHMGSLNASVAAGVLIYEVVRRRESVSVG